MVSYKLPSKTLWGRLDALRKPLMYLSVKDLNTAVDDAALSPVDTIALGKLRAYAHAGTPETVFLS
jgi:hypothetical protein